MKKLFKEKVSRFGSLISLIAVCAMLMLFFLALPETLTSTAGRVFAVTWALMAILVFTAHARRIQLNAVTIPNTLPTAKAFIAKEKRDAAFRGDKKIGGDLRLSLEADRISC